MQQINAFPVEMLWQFKQSCSHFTLCTNINYLTFRKLFTKTKHRDASTDIANKPFHIPELHFLLNSILPALAGGLSWGPCFAWPPFCFSPDAAETEKASVPPRKLSWFWGHAPQRLYHKMRSVKLYTWRKLIAARPPLKPQLSPSCFSHSQPNINSTVWVTQTYDCTEKNGGPRTLFIRSGAALMCVI